MNDLISRKMAIKAIVDLPNCYNGFSDTFDKAYIIGVLEELIPIDAVQVVRCRDCIHRYSTCPMITIHPTGSISFRAQDDWFCFMGERKEE